MGLAHNIIVVKDELFDILEGIPNMQLKCQAQLQCFADEQQILQAFSKLNLQKRNTEAKPATSEKKDVSCFNCNSSRHFATDGRKLRRQEGPWFECNSLEHRAADCSLHKKIPAEKR